MKEMHITLDSLALLLFCCELHSYTVVPVSSEEWGTVEKALRVHGLQGPASLLDMSYDEFIDILDIDEFIAEKMKQRIKTMPIFIKALYDVALKQVQVITKYDAFYPKTIVKSMKKRAPLYLFFSGEIEKMKEGISIAGLLEVSKKDHSYIKRLVSKVKDENLMCISNDTKGTDEVALQYALRHGCQSLLFVCHDFIHKQQEYRKYLKSGQLLLVSACDPSLPFTVTKAIDRNSYVCGLSKYLVIVSSHINNGATWFTALQNIHYQWTIPLVLDNDNMGNARLLDMGAVLLEAKDVLSDASFDMIYDRNKNDVKEIDVHINQISIFEFLGENNEASV